MADVGVLAAEDQRKNIALIEKQQAEIGSLKQQVESLKGNDIAKATVAELKGQNDALQIKIKELADQVESMKSSKKEDDPPDQAVPAQAAAPVQAAPAQATAASAGDDTTHNPYYDNTKKVRGDGTISPGSLRADMLGTACDLSRSGKSKTQPAGCFVDNGSDSECANAMEAIRGTCKLNRIKVPSDSPLGGRSKEYATFRGLDPGLQIKLHMFKARSYWSQAVNLMIGGSDDNLDRWLAPTNSETVGAANISFDDILEAVKNGKGVDQVAPEYSNAVRELSAKTYKHGQSGIEEASRHLYYALMIATSYTPSNAKALVSDSGVPFGAMAFLLDSEMQAMEWLAKLLTAADPDLLAEEPRSLFGSRRKRDASMRMAYVEVLRELANGTRESSVASYYQSVIGDVASAKGRVNKYLNDLKALLPAFVATKSSAAKEVISEGGKAHLAALGL